MSNGFCTICEDFEKYFSLSNLEAEISLVQELLKEEQGKCMVGISGGKDSTATLLTLLDRGAVPLSFTFDI